MEDLHAVVRFGTQARVHAPHLAPRAKRGDDGKIDVKDALTDLLGMAEASVRAEEADYLTLVRGILRDGNLSERIVKALGPHMDDDDDFTDAARRIYIELSDCLVENRPWRGRSD